MRPILIFLLILLTVPAWAQDLGTVLDANREQIERPSRQTIGPVIDKIAASGDGAVAFLEAWGDRSVGLTGDGRFAILREETATDAVTGAAITAEIDMLRPNSGVRGLIAAALVPAQLSDPDPARRRAALDALGRNAAPEHLAALRGALDDPDPDIAAQKLRLERLLTIGFDTDPAARVLAIESFAGNTASDVQARLNPLLATTRFAGDNLPAGANIARDLRVDEDITRDEAYRLLVETGLARARLTDEAQKSALAQHIENGRVGGVPVNELNDMESRDRAYAVLADQGLVQPAATAAEVDAALEANIFADVYTEPSAEVTDAAREALNALQTRERLAQGTDIALDALSLASIYFLAAIGLAITFGVMGVINMAHGEFIMMGAYTGYVVQGFIANRTLSLIVALPLAFFVTALAGVVLYRLVIRYLANRPLETLLATFGVSIALQQLAKNIFGTQARPLTAPDWLGGSISFSEMVSISTIRVAIFVLALLFLALFLFITKRTRLGLNMRAVTQNPGMAASMGINPDRVAMMTFGWGSGIAGIAGVAIGLFAQVTSELGQAYIVQSFMTVVVGGVGNIWGTLAGAALIGGLQKWIEVLNPANTLAAQTWMILFIIIFIQFRPRGIFPTRGRFVEG
ncbi:urea ABC transporter permease subunit UrtB [Paracoccus sp. SCSIO 75233]|uniref:urea ABC transporter permease subunit UrtB n=1 Tax=Paracoccus sp. SCSIO 75233 TaxID=3017782 RepID=UPI0022F0A62E|nr:urea ABC transporter permease subunit UrtB [Paracoccus sp. SCSIO 75233]WBU52412.1 urea ABC transporter permease subunit UrtB [Paracoccus sp. SCSIO 75233]